MSAKGKNKISKWGLKGYGMKRHARSGVAPHNKANAIQLSMATNKNIKAEQERLERIKKQGLVENIRDLLK